MILGYWSGRHIVDLLSPRVCRPDQAVDLSMHLGRTGEAYFVMLDDVPGDAALCFCPLPALPPSSADFGFHVPNSSPGLSLVWNA